MSKILHTQLTTANPRWSNSPFAVDGNGDITAFVISVDFDVVNDIGTKIDGGSRSEDIWPLLTAIQKTALQAFYDKIVTKIQEYV